MNFFDFAIKMELDGKAYYEKMIPETDAAGLKTILSMLASEEQKHYEMILDMKSGENVVMADTSILEDAKNVFMTIKEDKTLLKGMDKEYAVCRHAMKIEADSVRLYEDMIKKEENPETAKLLLKIANEEKKHYNIIENFYDFILKPEYYLEWREFSNLDRL